MRRDEGKMEDRRANDLVGNLHGRRGRVFGGTSVSVLEVLENEEGKGGRGHQRDISTGLGGG